MRRRRVRLPSGDDAYCGRDAVRGRLWRGPASGTEATRCGQYASSPSPRTARRWCSPTRWAASSRCPSTSGSPASCTPSRGRRRGQRPPGHRRAGRRRCPRGTSRPASAPASPPRTSPASPACRSTGCCATPARCCRSGRCSPSTPAAPGCKTSEKGAPLAEVVDARLAQHGIDTEKISWDAYRRDDGTWRIVATWPSGKATAQAIWDLDKARQVVTPHDDMAQYLCAERPAPLLGQEPAPGARAATRCPARPGASRAAAGTACRPRDRPREPPRPAATRSGPAATRCSPRSTGRSATPVAARAGGLDGRRRASGSARRRRRRGAARRPAGSAFDDDADAPKEVPAVPSLAVLRPRRTAGAGGTEQSDRPASRASACRAGTTCSSAAHPQRESS